MIKKIPFTQAGYQALINEQSSLAIQRKSAVTELQKSREMGDLSENSAYRVARSKLTRIDRRTRYLANMIKNSYIVAPQRKDQIEIGTRFTASLNGQAETYTLVNTFESDIEKGLLSAYSPIGKNAIGRKTGDEIKIVTPKGISILKILKIE